MLCQVKGDKTAYLIEINAFPNLNHDMPPKGSGPRPHELEFRKKGFDRDVLRILGLDDGSEHIGKDNATPPGDYKAYTVVTIAIKAQLNAFNLIDESGTLIVMDRIQSGWRACSTMAASPSTLR